MTRKIKSISIDQELIDEAKKYNVNVSKAARFGIKKYIEHMKAIQETTHKLENENLEY